MQGPVYWRGDSGYEEARHAAVWNELKPQREPEAIVYARSEADVVEAVQLAREHGLRVKARSGGHSWTGSSVRDGSVHVDLSALAAVEVNAGTRTATVQPGAQGRALNTLLAPHGLMFPTGHCPTVGIGGYLLQGGWGWNSPHVGPACLSVTGVDVVTATGEVVHADEHENTDLLWAARGAGAGFFGIVTRFQLRCHPRPASMMASVYVYPMDVLDELLRWALELQPSLPSQMEFVILGMTPRDGLVPGEGTPQLVINANVFFDSDAESRAALELLDSFPARTRALVADTYRPMTMDELYDMGAAAEVPGYRWAVDNMWTDAGADELVPLLRDVFLTLPTPASHVFWMRWRPQEIRDAALSVTGNVYVAAFSGWTDPADDVRLRRWGLDHMRRLDHLSNGIQLADENLDARPTSRYLSAEASERLERLRTEWDPDNLFCGYLAGNG